MNLTEIIKEYLKQNKHDGLASVAFEEECGCTLSENRELKNVNKALLDRNQTLGNIIDNLKKELKETTNELVLYRALAKDLYADVEEANKQKTHIKQDRKQLKEALNNLEARYAVLLEENKTLWMNRISLLKKG